MNRFNINPSHFYILKVAAIGVIVLTVLVAGISFTLRSTDKIKSAGGSPIAEWTVAKQCIDGTEVYQLSDGTYALWRGENENDQHWTRLADGVDPDDYCR